MNQPPYRAVRLSYLLSFQGPLPFDVYIERHPGKYTRIHRRHDVYDSEVLTRFEMKAEGELHIPQCQTQELNCFLCEVLQSMLTRQQDLSEKEVTEIISLAMELTYQCILEQDDEFGSNLGHAHLLVKSCVNLITASDLRSGVHIYLAIAEDHELLKHSLHVMLLSLAIAQSVGFSNEKVLATIGLGAFLHDIGHSRLDEELFRKSRLSPKDWESIKDHPHLGIKIINHSKGMSPEVHSIILQHHEHCNGRGYPNRLTQSQIYPPARIVAVADAFSSLVLKSSYRSISHRPAEAMHLLRADLGHFDPVYLNALEQVLGMAKKRSAA